MTAGRDAPPPAASRYAARMVRTEKNGPVTTVVLSRPERRNAVDRDTADALFEAFAAFDRDEAASVAVLWGEGPSAPGQTFAPSPRVARTVSSPRAPARWGPPA